MVIQHPAVCTNSCTPLVHITPTLKSQSVVLVTNNSMQTCCDEQQVVDCGLTHCLQLRIQLINGSATQEDVQICGLVSCGGYCELQADICCLKSVSLPTDVQSLHNRYAYLITVARRA